MRSRCRTDTGGRSSERPDNLMFDAASGRKDVGMKEKQNKSILSSTLARMIAFFWLAISFFVGSAGILTTLMLWEADAYTSGVTQMIKDVMRSRVVWDDVNYVKTLYQEGDLTGIESYLSRRNVDMEIYNINVAEGQEDILLWSNYEGNETRYSFNCFTEIHVKTTTEPESSIDHANADAVEETEYIVFQNQDAVFDADWTQEIESAEQEEWQEVLFRVYVEDTFPYGDEYREIHAWGVFIEDYLYVIPVAAAISVLLFVSCFLFLMCSAGHYKHQDGITGGVLYFFPFDFVTAVFAGVALVGLLITVEMIRYGNLPERLIAIVLLGCCVIWGTIYCMDLAVELKKGTILKHTLIYGILHKSAKGIGAFWRAAAALIHGIPLVTGIVLAYGVFAVVELLAMTFFCELWSMDADVLLLCVLEKILLFPLVLYLALMCKKLQLGSKELAEGNLTYKLDTTKMILGFREHGENLNSIGEGIAVAVDDRMKSERLKTELITNVSHDLKTPLTSIINYADLIGTEVTRLEGIAEDEKVQLTEYSEVLLRQSKRLKKLLEDLVEASKATTGNLEVNLVPCEVGVILSQAIGEYVQRFAEKELELLVRQPEEPVYILADGKHLWRVFDNLMNNICKYAQEGSRVYLTVEPREDTVEIVFRNMSKYALEVSAEELQERFVRGDQSRHMEGNGLGLSIAGSLIELQNGQMEIVIDGDLFKVILQLQAKK